jgi:GNAT superfamily N-acetyltransferase
MTATPSLPTEALEQRWSESLINGAHVSIRPINKHDAAAERTFIQGLSTQSKRYRFLGHMRESQVAQSAVDRHVTSDAFIQRMTDIDQLNHVALVATARIDSSDIIVGVSRYYFDPQSNHCECAVVVADAWQGKGLGSSLMKHLIQIARGAGIKSMESIDMAENLAMRDFAKRLGFHVRIDPNDATQVIYRLDL